MGNCVIFCAGEFDGLVQPIGENDLVIAADGGLAHIRKLGITPDRILGDFDSLGYIPENASVFPVEKDDTDAMLAVRLGLAAGCDRFFLYGGLDGPRLDHTVANFQTLQFLADRSAKGYLIGKTHIVTVIKDGSQTFPAEMDGIVSVFCMGSDAKGITLQNLKYTLENGTLSAGFPLGVSNHFIGKPATISVTDGSLLVIFEKQEGFANG